jgi:hypothetical protein
VVTAATNQLEIRSAYCGLLAAVVGGHSNARSGTRAPHSPATGQEHGKKWTAAVDLQPTLPRSDRLLESALTH